MAGTADRVRNKRHHPLVGQGIVFPISVSIVCWVDLLGYGEMLAQSGFNPLHERSHTAKQRLSSFHDCVGAAAGRHFRTFVVNDGAVIYRDLSMRARSVTHDFFMRCWSLFKTLQRVEFEQGNPGPRMVIAAGFRLRSQGRMVDENHVENIMRRFKSGKISAEQAIMEAARSQAAFGSVPDLQANFAFTKAYVAEQSGKKGGLKGSKLFVDMLLFTEDQPDWLIFEERIHWRSSALNLEADFSAVGGVNRLRHPEGGPASVRNALQIAQILADNEDVLSSLRRSSEELLKRR